MRSVAVILTLLASLALRSAAEDPMCSRDRMLFNRTLPKEAHLYTLADFEGLVTQNAVECCIKCHAEPSCHAWHHTHLGGTDAGTLCHLYIQKAVVLFMYNTTGSRRGLGNAIGWREQPTTTKWVSTTAVTEKKQQHKVQQGGQDEATEQDNDKTLIIALAVLGAVFGLMLIAIVVYKITNRKKSMAEECEVEFQQTERMDTINPHSFFHPTNITDIPVQEAH